ncbi:MAG: phenylalanine--tRNA ligase subunit beta [Oscillospiraceae bacterium]|jgi:phenylalanyl-tRNA synthetase beta chain|nr:phenylalanine--tRNA ligase subunit beta [Oscillospiraceae bacterium]
MLLSLNWLGDFVTITDKIEDFCRKMTFSGSKVESFECLAEDIRDVVVGKVEKISTHPDAQKLVVCQVDIGSSHNVQIVTGATNLFEGAIVPVAVDGACLPGDVKIKSRKFRGVESNGMLCSLGELGLNHAFFPTASADGILIIEDRCEVGQDIRDALLLKDTVVDFEITSNRTDCLSVWGLAREAAATYGLKFNKPVAKFEFCPADNLKVEVARPDLCPHYMVKYISDVNFSFSPLWLRARLKAAGIRPISGLVDITNYVCIEIGQPLHVFDAGKVAGKIIVRTAKPNEKIVTLDGVVRELDDSMLVIADEEKALAIAGVMGGFESGVTEATRNVIFESANFNHVSVRQTANALGLRTESSQRFGKQMPFTCEDGLSRACELVKQLGIAVVDNSAVDVCAERRKPKHIKLDCSAINKILGTDLDRKQIVETLNRLDFDVTDDDDVVVPDFRLDIEINVDLAEEVARIKDYNEIQSVPLSGVYGVAPERQQQFEDRVVELVVAAGFHEVLTYTMVSPKHFNRLCLPPDAPERDFVAIKNPLGEETSIMRTTTLPSMLEALALNHRQKNEKVLLFDLGCDYIKSEFDDENGKRLVDERQMLTIGAYGNDCDFYSIKAVLVNLLGCLGISGHEFAKTPDLAYVHPGRTATISVEGCVLGFVGELHPTVAKNYDLPKGTLVARLNMRDMFGLSTSKVYTPIPRYPAVLRDIAVICDVSMPAAEIEKTIRDVAKDMLVLLRLFDVYTGDQIPDDKKSVAYELHFQSKVRTLKDEEVDKLMVKIIRALEDKRITLR